MITSNKTQTKSRSRRCQEMGRGPGRVARMMTRIVESHRSRRRWGIKHFIPTHFSHYDGKNSTAPAHTVHQQIVSCGPVICGRQVCQPTDLGMRMGANPKRAPDEFVARQKNQATPHYDSEPQARLHSPATTNDSLQSPFISSRNQGCMNSIRRNKHLRP